jgi:hypothetical protein
MIKNSTMLAMMDTLMLNPTLDLPSPSNLAKLASLTLLSKLDKVLGQDEASTALTRP